MDPLVISIIGLVAFFFLMSQGMHIAFSFMFVGFMGVALLRGLDSGFSLIGQQPFVWASNGNLIAVPLFILMGQFVFHAGIGTELFEFVHKWIGRFRGGLALATTVASAAFGACSGISLASAATMGTVAYPEMEKYKYDRRLSTGCITAGGALSCLIPPSVAFIIYGVLTEQSIAKLFIAGILPGLLLATMFLLLIIIMCRRNPQLGPPGPSYTWKEMLVSLKGVVGVLILFIVVMGGLFMGVFTPSEAGAMGAFGAFVIAAARGKLTKSSVVAAVRDALKTSGFILTITIGAMMFSNFLAVGGFSGMFREWIEALPLSRNLIMISILFIYIPLGMVMDVLAMILLTVPIVYPVVQAMGFDPIWFGVVLTLLAEMGLLTPPVGLSTYVVSGVTKVPLEEVFRGIAPFVVVMLLCLAVLYAFPQISTFLPGIMG